jgi:CRISP-associated protein Cas1
MRPVPGARPAEPQELVRISERMSFLYVEHAVIHREDDAITMATDRGTVHVPAAQLAAMLVGPGCRVTHHAVMLLAQSGTTVVWVGENGVRFYASGRGLSRSNRLLEAQARLVSNSRSRLGVARAMYEMRFPDEDVAGLTMQQLRGREGARVRSVYQDHARRTGVQWRRRDYRPDDFAASDPVNQALSAANTSLYGAVHAVVTALGCSPGLGFVHTGTDRAFVHDVADLYKAQTSIPVAFDTAATEPDDVPGHARRLMRDAIYEHGILEQCVKDIRNLLAGEDPAVLDDEWAAVTMLWNGTSTVAGGTNYGPDESPDW